jgi:hypothetical protein
MWLYPLERDGSSGVRESLEGTHKYPAHEFSDAGHSPHRDEVEAPNASISTQRGR